jgi:hypothetical protein
MSSGRTAEVCGWACEVHEHPDIGVFVPINRSHQRYLDVLFSRAEAERYPSHQYLSRIEAATTDRETAERYVDLLLDEAETQRYPSLLMMDRARHMVTKMAVADRIQEIEEEIEADRD